VVRTVVSAVAGVVRTVVSSVAGVVHAVVAMVLLVVLVRMRVVRAVPGLSDTDTRECDGGGSDYCSELLHGVSLVVLQVDVECERS
jgi:hypothetical protein